MYAICLVGTVCGSKMVQDSIALVRLTRSFLEYRPDPAGRFSARRSSGASGSTWRTISCGTGPAWLHIACGTGPTKPVNAVSPHVLELQSSCRYFDNHVEAVPVPLTLDSESKVLAGGYPDASFGSSGRGRGLVRSGSVKRQHTGFPCKSITG
eukprot:4029033-Amphidinium_carterae.1